VNIRQDVVIPEAHDAKDESFQFSRSQRILNGLDGVLPTIDLDDQPRFKRDEVNDISAKRILSSELVAVGSAVAQTRPHQALRVRTILAKQWGASFLQSRTPSPNPLPFGE